jgi:phage-related protein
MKPLKFVSRSREDLQEFPGEVRRAMGLELRRVQSGEMPKDFKPMPSVGRGVYEIRVHLEGSWRLMYLAKLADAVWVLHAFQKKTQQTSQDDIELAKKRLREIGG